MTPAEIRQAVLDAMARIAPEGDYARLKPNLPIRDQIDIDSYDFLNIVVLLHERLGVNVPEADYQQLATLDSTVDYLAVRLAAP